MKYPGLSKKSIIMMLMVMSFLLVVDIFLPDRALAENLLQRHLHFSYLMQTKAPVASVIVKNSYPHDRSAFTQGLFFHDGYLYESTGLKGKSTLVRKELTTGKILQEIRIDQEYFGEGIALHKGKIYKLTWQNETVMVYDLQSLRQIKTMKYSGEGWGLTSDGKHLLMSNGSATIFVRDPETFKVLREIHVHDGETPVGNLNELEFVQGEIWANIYLEDLIVRIAPQSGKVTGWIDISTLRSYLPRHAQVDVLNGIAYDEKNGSIFVTGKYWPKIFEIKLSR